MNRFFTILIIPERGQSVRSFKVPRMIVHGLSFTLVAFSLLLVILGYDYWKILKQVYENNHLTIENRQLKEQIQLFQMKINALSDDLERIHTFEKKLRIITGFENNQTTQKPQPEAPSSSVAPQEFSLPWKKLDKSNRDYQNLKQLYEKKIASSFGMMTAYGYTKEWSDLVKRSFSLAEQYAEFDHTYNQVKSFVDELEINIHQLDQYLLDKDSYLKSMPTLLPTKGWITSYHGPRKSHISNRIKMHEGIDIGARPGTPIISPADGIVTFSGTKPGFGKFVQLDHGYGLETIFAHASKLKVKKGQIIKRGQQLALVGSTGYSTGPHVHYEVRVNGSPVDPIFYILD